MELFFAAVALAVLFFVLVILLVYLVVQKGKENRRQYQLHLYKEWYQRSIVQYVRGETRADAFSFSSDLEKEAVLELLDHFANLLEGEAVKERIRLFAEKHFQEWLRRQLKSRRWSMRMNALFFIEDLQMKTMIPDIEQLYHSAVVTKSEETKILTIYAEFGYFSVCQYMISPKYELSEFTYRVVFGHMNEAMLGEMRERFWELPPLGRYAFIDMIGIRRRQHEGEFLEYLLTADEPEIRIRSLKALAAMGCLLGKDELERHLHSPHWQERLMAAKLCGSIKAEQYVPLLIKLLCDVSFPVRAQAAEALARMPHGKEILKKAAVSASDRYARDMAQQWLERGWEQ
jgi:hypothetical protein